MRKIILSLMICFPLFAMAQEGAWTLDRCIQYALDHNLSVKQGDLNVQQQQVNLSTARNAVWPAVSASATQSLSFGRGISEDNTYVSSNTANTSFGLGASVDLFTGLRTKSRIDIGKLNLEVATADLERARHDVRVAVTQAYVQVLYNMRIHEVALAQIAIDSVQVARMEALAQAGRASSAEVYAQRSALAQSRLACTQAANNLKISLLELSQLLELSSPEGFAVVMPETSSIEGAAIPAAEAVYADALRTMPSVQAESLRVDVAQKNITLAQSGWYPSLSLSGGLSTDYYALLGRTGRGFGEQLKNNFSPYVGLSLNVPIFDRLATRDNVRIARLQQSSQELQLETVKKTLYKEVQQAYYGAVAARDKYVSSRAAEESAREAFNVVTARYENGKANITEFNEAKQNYMQASSNCAQAQYEFLFYLKLIELYRAN